MNLPSMNRYLLDYICCPRCQGILGTTGTAPIVNGVLLCSSCQASYEIREGVPILISDISEQEKFTAKNFGEQWEKFAQVKGLGAEFEERQFYEYFYPYDTSTI